MGALGASACGRLALDGDDAALALTALAFAGWHVNYRYRPRCGAPVRLVSVVGPRDARCATGLNIRARTRRSSSSSRDHDGRSWRTTPLWRPGFVSIIAGYVEVGISGRHGCP